MADIKVHVARYGDRKNLMMRYTDLVTAKLVARSTGTTSKREAEKVAAKWEAELQEGRYQKPLRMTKAFGSPFTPSARRTKVQSSASGY